MREIRVRTRPPGKFTQDVDVGDLHFVADETREAGGDGAGPDPFDLLLSALGACTSMTVKMYADRKGIPLASVDVSVRATKGDVFAIERVVRLHGQLTREQRDVLLGIANKCPLHKTLTHPISIATTLADEA